MIAVQVASSNAEQLRDWDGAGGAFWAENADRFDAGVAAHHGPFLAAAAVQPTDRVLDVGCGNGQNTRDAARAASSGSAVGVDLSAAMLDHARRAADAEGLANVSFLQADAQIHPFDATSFDVADTSENVERFGRMGSGPKASAYPKLQVAALAECGSHAIVGAVLGGCRTGERTLAADLTSTVGPNMLVMADAGLYSYELFTAFAATGADLAWRIGASVSVGRLRWLADGSYLALIYTPGMSAQRRARLVEQVNSGQDIPADLARLVRVVEYTVPDRNPDGDLIVVVTTITDPHEVSAVALASAYQQRWEEESALDELKTDLRGRGEVLRSKTPDLVEQQMWGLLLAHYAIRALLHDAADPAGYDPDRMSYIKGLRVVRRQVTDQAAITP